MAPCLSLNASGTVRGAGTTTDARTGLPPFADFRLSPPEPGGGAGLLAFLLLCLRACFVFSTTLGSSARAYRGASCGSFTRRRNRPPRPRTSAMISFATRFLFTWSRGETARYSARFVATRSRKAMLPACSFGPDPLSLVDV